MEDIGIGDALITNPLKKCLEELERRDQRIKDLLACLCRSDDALALLARDPKFEDFIQKIKSPVLRQIVISNLRNQDRPPTGRRWTDEEKENALLLYRRSPKAYRLIEKMFLMPSIRSVSRAMKDIPIGVGLNTVVLDEIKQKVARMETVEKQCILMFDEMALRESLEYNEGSPNVKGFENYGNGEVTDKIANRALVFMVQGLAHRYKMPIAYYFVRGTISSQRLSHLLPTIIRAVNATGLNVVATVCDAGATNQGAWNILSASNPSDRPGPYISVDHKRIVWLWDGLHLWKSWRNNLCGN